MKIKPLPDTTSAIAADPALRQREIVINKLVNDTIQREVVASAQAAGSRGPVGSFYSNIRRAAIKAVIPQAVDSNADDIARLPVGTRAILCLVLAGLSRRIPVWIEEARCSGDPKFHKAAYAKAKVWCPEEGARLDLMEVDRLVALVEAEIPLPAIEQTNE